MRSLEVIYLRAFEQTALAVSGDEFALRECARFKGGEITKKNLIGAKKNLIPNQFDSVPNLSGWMQRLPETGQTLIF